MSDKSGFSRGVAGRVAFSLCMVQGDSLYAEYVGFDYAVALDLHPLSLCRSGHDHLGISKGYKWFRSSA